MLYQNITYILTPYEANYASYNENWNNLERENIDKSIMRERKLNQYIVQNKISPNYIRVSATSQMTFFDF